VTSTTSTLGELFAFFGLREDPFHISPNPRFYFSTTIHDSAFAELLTGIQTRQGLLVLTGDAGTGKTTLINQILEWLGANERSSAFVFHTRLEPVELLEFILRDFGIVCASSRKCDLIAALHQWLFERNDAGDSPVVILDESQVLSLSTLDELRLLLNLENDSGKLLQIVLVGQLELEEKLRDPELHQLRQRIMIHSRLTPLGLEETSRYISSRLRIAGSRNSGLFPPDTVMAIHCSSHGIPRIINLLCKEALISAYANQLHMISPEHIYGIASELDFRVNSIVAGAAKFPVTAAPVPPVIDPEVDRHGASWLVAPPPTSSDGVRSEIQSSLGPAAADPNAAEPVDATHSPDGWSSVNDRRAGYLWAWGSRLESLVRFGTEVSASFVRYLFGISTSFVHDFRMLIRRLIAPPTHSVPIGSPGHRPLIRKKAMVFLSHWLREPASPARMRRVSRPARQTSSKRR